MIDVNPMNYNECGCKSGCNLHCNSHNYLFCYESVYCGSVMAGLLFRCILFLFNHCWVGNVTIQYNERSKVMVRNEIVIRGKKTVLLSSGMSPLEYLIVNIRCKEINLDDLIKYKCYLGQTLKSSSAFYIHRSNSMKLSMIQRIDFGWSEFTSLMLKYWKHAFKFLKF